MAKRHAITIGQRQEKLIVLGFWERDAKNRRLVTVFCEACSTTRTMLPCLLRKYKSCGCQMHIGRPIHGRCGTAEYRSWMSMKNRCLNPNVPDYYRYGGRGIKICKRWLKFENFFVDMGERPKGTTLDRINNNGNYEPKNCRWATHREQDRNTRRNRYFTCQGESLILADWAARYKINLATLSSRVYRHGWTIDKALTAPLKNNGRKR